MRPAELEALFRAGLQEMNRGDWAAGADCFQKVVRLAPKHLGALVGLAAAQMRLGRLEEAETACRRALGLDPRQPVAFRTLAATFQAQERHDDALALADGVLALDADHPEALFARGGALFSLGRFDEALASYERAALHPSVAYRALLELGATAAALRQLDAAMGFFDRAVALQPEDANDARLRRAGIRLREGDFAEGWRDYEARWRVEAHIAHSAGVVSRELAARLDTRAGPEDLVGQRILVLGEQGIGDQLMFASMIPDLVSAAASVVCVCDPRLAGLLAASFPDAVFTGPAQATVRPSGVDRILAMGSLGRLYRNRSEDFPGAPYLRPRADLVRSWAARLGPRPPGLRIGVSWRGGAPATRRSTRSLPLARLAPLFALPGCEFVNLQYGDVAAELEACPTPIRSFPAAETEDFEQLAALVCNLDVVVSVQTALVHLAGALGVPCLTLVPQQAEWRYGASGGTLPWYGSVSLFRQPRAGDWESPLRLIVDELTGRLPNGAG